MSAARPSTPVTVWESLQTQGQAVAKGVAYIDPDTLQPDVDPANLSYDPATSILDVKYLTIQQKIALAKSAGLWRRYASSFVAVSCPADATEDILATINLVGGDLGANGVLRLTTWWTVTNSANNKTLRAKLGGIGGTAYLSSVQTAITQLKATSIIANRNAVNSQYGSSENQVTGVVPVLAISTSAVDTGVATTLVITGQKATLGETLTLEGYLLEILSKD